MLTVREAHQRAALYGCYVAQQRRENKTPLYAATRQDWGHQERLEKARWREDIEDAVLDCGRIGSVKVHRRNSKYLGRS